MPADADHPPYRFIRKLLPYTTVALALAILYVGWVFYSRWQENRKVQQKAAAEQIAAARRTYQAYGGGRLKILNFYAAPAVIRRGETGRLCYGVANAKAVRIEPPVEGVWPSLSRCVDVAPKRDTTYTVIAEDAGGRSETAVTTLRVRK